MQFSEVKNIKNQFLPNSLLKIVGIIHDYYNFIKDTKCLEYSAIS